MPQFGLLSHVSSLRLSSGHSGLVSALSNVACTSLFSPRLLVVDMSVWASSLLGIAIRHIICVCLFIYLFIYLFIFPPGYAVLCDSKTPHRPAGESVSWCLETFPLLRLPPRMDLHPYLFCLSFSLLYFVLPPFKDNGLPFWVPGVLCQHSEVVLWNLLSIQMIFQ